MTSLPILGSLFALSLALVVTGCQGKNNKLKIGNRQKQQKTLGITTIPTKNKGNEKCLDLAGLVKELREKKTWSVQYHDEDLALYSKESNFLAAEYTAIDNPPAQFSQMKNEGITYFVAYTQDLDWGWTRFPDKQDGCDSVTMGATDHRENNAGPTNPRTPSEGSNTTYKISDFGNNYLVFENEERLTRYTFKLESADTLIITKESLQEIGDICNVKSDYFSVVRTRMTWGEETLPTTLPITSRLARLLEKTLPIARTLEEALDRTKKDLTGTALIQIPLQSYLQFENYIAKGEDLQQPKCPGTPATVEN